MEQLSSKVLNIQIVSMRKEVRKAVVCQIHGLTQKANRLRIKNGSDEQKIKNALKADNFVSEIQILKKLKADDVSLFALSNPSEADLKALICKPITSPEGKAMAKLCLRENMRNVVNRFISSYNDSLELLNNLISDRYNKTDKTKMKKKKKGEKKCLKDNKQQSEINGVRQHSMEDITDANDSNSQLIPIPADYSTEKKPVEIFGSSDEKESEIENSSIEEDINIRGSSVSDEEMSGSDDEDHEPGKKSAPGGNIHRSISSEKGLEVERDVYITNKDSLNMDKQIEKRSTEESRIFNRDLKLLKTERNKVDPFFKTSNDTEYFTYCDVENKAAVEKDVVSNFHDFQVGKRSMDSFKTGFGNKNSLKKDFNSKNPLQSNSDDKNLYRRNFQEKSTNKRNFNSVKSFNHSFNGKQRSLDTNIKNTTYDSRGTDRKPRQKMSQKHPPNHTQEVKLHPSWEAKKKLNQPPGAFQGKKIVFD